MRAAGMQLFTKEKCAEFYYPIDSPVPVCRNRAVRRIILSGWY
jgi:hypothetical protein